MPPAARPLLSGWWVAMPAPAPRSHPGRAGLTGPVPGLRQ